MDYLNNTDIRDKYYFSKYVYKQKHHCLVFQSAFNRKLLNLVGALKNKLEYEEKSTRSLH